MSTFLCRYTSFWCVSHMVETPSSLDSPQGQFTCTRGTPASTSRPASRQLPPTLAQRADDAGHAGKVIGRTEHVLTPDQLIGLPGEHVVAAAAMGRITGAEGTQDGVLVGLAGEQGHQLVDAHAGKR